MNGFRSSITFLATMIVLAGCNPTSEVETATTTTPAAEDETAATTNPVAASIPSVLLEGILGGTGEGAHIAKGQCIEVQAVNEGTDRLFLYPRKCSEVPLSMGEGPWLAAKVEEHKYAFYLEILNQDGEFQLHSATLKVEEDGYNENGMPITLDLDLGAHWGAVLSGPVDPGHGKTGWHLHP